MVRGRSFLRWKTFTKPRSWGKDLEYYSEENSKDLINYCDNIYLKFGANKVVHGLNNDKFEIEVHNLYTIGNGAGITRGLMQTSVTGVIVARDIVKKYKII